MLKLVLSLSLLLAVATAGFAYGPDDTPATPVRQGPDTGTVAVLTQEQADRERLKKSNEMRQEEISAKPTGWSGFY